jgi:hypothetical protein
MLAEDALPVYRMALEESRNAFAALMAQPEKIRRNVGALLGFAAIGVSIFGFAAGRPTGIFGWICQVGALLGLIGLVICAAYVTLPRKLIPSMDADQIVGWGDDGDKEAEAVKNLALGVEENYRKNAAVTPTRSAPDARTIPSRGLPARWARSHCEKPLIRDHGPHEGQQCAANLDEKSLSVPSGRLRPVTACHHIL